MVLVTWLTCACEEKVELVERLRPVVTFPVELSDGSTRRRSFSGSAQIAQQVNLSFRVQGTVVAVPVSVGERVTGDTLVAALDKERYRVALEEAKADLAQANASRRSSEAEYQRVRQLYAADNASRTELDEALASAEASKADFSARSQALRRAELDLSYTELRADADCSVAFVDVDVNENVQSGAVVARLNCGDTWEVVIDVPESQIAYFENGLSATVRFSSIDGSYSANVSEVGVASDGNSSFPVTLRLLDVPQAIRANLAADVDVLLRSAGSDLSIIVVPPMSVSQDQNGTFVYLVRPSEEPGVAVLERRSVDVGKLNELGLEITDGLQDGDTILLAGHANARPGMRVLAGRASGA
ncbi:MAG: efflux RND transporter periplasmic adaptor subunit [Pseudomonadota bacterium]